MDEHAWLRGNATRRTQFATGIVDLSPGRAARLFQVCPGRSGKVYADWLTAQPQSWRDGVRVAALDPFARYAPPPRCAPACRTPPWSWTPSTWSSWPTRPSRKSAAESSSRRWVIGATSTPAVPGRRLLTRNATTLSPEQLQRLDAALAVGDPDDEVTVAWQAAQRVHAIYRSPDPAQGSSTGPPGGPRPAQVPIRRSLG